MKEYQVMQRKEETEKYSYSEKERRKKKKLYVDPYIYNTIIHDENFTSYNINSVQSNCIYIRLATF